MQHEFNRPFMSRLGADPDAAALAGIPGDDLVRPFLMTGGRTRSSYDEIQIETIVVITEEGQARQAQLSFERARLIELCREPHSVAELSAKLKLPLGVARVLAGDMAAEGLLAMSGVPETDPTKDVDLIRRLIHGVQKL